MMKQIGVIGSSLPTEEGRRLAYQVGYFIAKNNCIVVCGGLGGIMEEVCRGAKAAGGLTVGILPTTSPQDANPYVDIKIPTGMSEARNIIIIRSSAAVIAIEGHYGTLSELAYALYLNVPIIGLNTWELDKLKKSVKIIKASSAEEAVQIALSKIHQRIDKSKKIKIK